METNGRFVADGVLDASSWFGNPIALFQRSADSGALTSGFSSVWHTPMAMETTEIGAFT